MSQPNIQPVLRGGRLVTAALAVFAVTVSVPPVAAWRLNTNRVAQTQAMIADVAVYVRANLDELSAGELSNEIIRGGGRLPFPREDEAGEWGRRAVRSPGVLGGRGGPDSWGRCLFVDLEGIRLGRHVWVISAGPDMVVETPPGSPVLVADDIGVLIK